jgi:hypothetical protein
MPQNIKLRVSVNAGAPQEGQADGVTIDYDDALVFSINDVAGVDSALFRIYEFPDGFAEPSGWSTSSEDGAYYYLSKNGAPPPTVAAPPSPLWGDFLCDVKVNQGKRQGVNVSDLYDNSLGLTLPSPNGVPDFPYQEDKQFNTQRSWVSKLKNLARTVSAGVSGALPNIATDRVYGNATGGSSPPVSTPIQNITATQGTTTAKIAPWATMALLRADVAAMPAGFVARSAGHTTAGDGGHGEWLCETGAPGTYTHDGGITIVPSSGTGSDGSKALVRKFTGPIDARWFGFDLTGATNDAAKLTALVAAGPHIRLANGIYRSDTAVTVPAGRLIEGETIDGTIVWSNGTNKNVFEVSGSDTTIKNLTVRGNLTGVGATSEGAGGHGIFINDAENVLVERCLFQQIGKAAGVASSSGCVWARNSTNIHVDKCFFDDDNDSVTGCDVGMAYSVAVGKVTDCVSISEHDSFFGGPSVASEQETIFHIITGNIAIRESEAPRSGVLGSYGMPSRVIVTGNIIQGFLWNGVYFAGNELDGALPNIGGGTVSNNLIMYCGGVGSISAGVLVGSDVPMSISDNLIWWQGYTTEEVARTPGDGNVPTWGIKLYTRGSGHHVHHNTIAHPRDGGVTAYAFSGYGTLENIHIDHNTILEHQGTWQDYAIQLNSSTLDVDYTIRDITVSDNHVSHATDKGGINITFSGSGTPVPVGIRIERNVCICKHGTPTGKGYLAQSSVTGRFVDNVIDGYGVGFETPGPIGNRHFPDNMIADRNEFRNCATGIDTYATYNQIFFNTVFKNCTTRMASGAYNGRHLGNDASGNILVEVFGAAAPTGGGTGWLVGDRWLRTESVAIGSSLGAVCTTAGGPGTWTPLANL